MTTKIFKLFHTTTFRLMSIIFSLLYFAAILIYHHKTFVALDEKPIIKTVDAKTQRLASQVTVGLHINNFPEFSFEKKYFIVDCTVWFKFPATTESIKTIEQFTIQSSFMQENGELLYRSAPVIKRLGDEVLVTYYVQTSFSTYPNFKNFPIGDHTLNIIIQNRNVTPEELCFISEDDTFTFAKKTFSSWSIKKATTTTGYLTAHLYPKSPQFDVSYPVALFSIDFEQNGFNHLFSLYLPLFVIFLFALLSFFFELGAIERINTMAAVIPMLVFFKLVINTVAPTIGYLTHVDYVFCSFVFIALIILFFQIYVFLKMQQIKEQTPEEQNNEKNRMLKLNDIVFFISLFLLAIFATYALFR